MRNVSKKMINLPPLNQLKAFEAVARHLSFTKAGNELCVTPGALTRHIQLLEEFFNLQLFNRSKKKISLTQSGEALYISTKQAFELLSRTAFLLKNSKAELRIKVFHSFAVRWLLSRLKNFEATYPDINMSLTISSNEVNLVNEEYDAAIIYSKNPPENYSYIEMLSEQLIPVCAPSFLPDNKPFSISEIFLHSIILSTIKGTAWKEWSKVYDVPDFDLSSALRFENDDAAIQAAIAGFGIALVNSRYIETELNSGTLKLATDLEPVSLGAHYFIYSKQAEQKPEFNLLKNWITSQVQTVKVN